MTASLAAQPRGSHFVNGQYLDDATGTALPVYFPATGEVIAHLYEATPAIIELALESAHRAQQEWATLRPIERSRILLRAVDLIRERGEELAQLETLDTGKPIQETRVADWPSGADALEFFAGLAPSVGGESIPLGQDFVYTRREPIGLCVGIGAWNYPSQIACWKAAPALALGNAMVFKPSELTPLGALKLAEILVEAGLPAGLFNVVQGRGAVGSALITDNRVNKVSLTGSVPTGQKVYAAAAHGLRHVTMELGGKSPLIVFDDASLEDAVGASMLANFYSSGQICSNGTRVFVQKGLHDRFVARLTARMAAIKMGDPRNDDTQLGPMISPAQADKVMHYVEAAQVEGADLATGGRRHIKNGAHFIEPTAFINVTDEMTIAREEIFGPVMSILKFEDEAEVIARANATEFGLAAGVFTADLTRAHRVVGRLQAGTCWINAYNLTPVEAPFGGVKMSGVGRENGQAAVQHYTQVKSVYVGMGAVDAPY